MEKVTLKAERVNALTEQVKNAQTSCTSSRDYTENTRTSLTETGAGKYKMELGVKDDGTIDFQYTDAKASMWAPVVLRNGEDEAVTSTATIARCIKKAKGYERKSWASMPKQIAAIEQLIADGYQLNILDTPTKRPYNGYERIEFTADFVKQSATHSHAPRVRDRGLKNWCIYAN